MRPILSMISIILLACTFLSFGPHSENYFVIEGMQVEWEYEGDEITFKLHSPYQGWLALGFNQQNDIMNTNLVKGAVTTKGVELQEYFILGYGEPQSVEALGGQSAVQEFVGLENADGTSFQFTMKTQLQDGFHYDLSPGQRVWIICSYSMEDDFGHYSVMQRHIEITL
ncbi:MAG: DOMON domain-containing protein [Bacteroidota bacterium]